MHKISIALLAIGEFMLTYKYSVASQEERVTKAKLRDKSEGHSVHEVGSY